MALVMCRPERVIAICSYRKVDHYELPPELKHVKSCSHLSCAMFGQWQCGDLEAETVLLTFLIHYPHCTLMACRLHSGRSDPCCSFPPRPYVSATVAPPEEKRKGIFEA
eukprot:768555-Hanusia_phi.AAC.1